MRLGFLLYLVTAEAGIFDAFRGSATTPEAPNDESVSHELIFSNDVSDVSSTIDNLDKSG